jgi:hypothetical protein
MLHAKPEGPDKFAIVLSDLGAQLTMMDRYERRAQSRRKFAIREFDLARNARLSNMRLPTPTLNRRRSLYLHSSRGKLRQTDRLRWPRWRQRQLSTNIQTEPLNAGQSSCKQQCATQL